MLTLVVNLALPRTVVMAHTGQTSTTPLDRGADKACITYLGLSKNEAPIEITSKRPFRG